MGKSTLGRVLDPGELATSTAPRARLAVVVPAAWLVEGADLAVTVPVRLVCAHCDGGGCDGCSRSGALRAPDGAGARVVRTSVPPTSRGVALRIPHPFGAGHAIEQLLLELRAGDAPSACVARVAPARPPRAAGAGLPWSILAAAVIAAVLFALIGR